MPKSHALSWVIAIGTHDYELILSQIDRSPQRKGSPDSKLIMAVGFPDGRFCVVDRLVIYSWYNYGHMAEMS